MADLALRIATPNGEDGSPIDWFQPSKTKPPVKLTIGSVSSPTLFPPADKFPRGGALFGHWEGAGPLVYSTTPGGEYWPIPEGYFGLAFDEPEVVYLWSLGEPVVYRVSQAKEVA